MIQPLVSRPPYGMVRIPVSQSGLPVGDPAGRGVPLDPAIPGYNTFAKPPNEEPREPSVEDSSIYRIDDADDLLKDQSYPDGIDHSRANPTYRRPGPHIEPNKPKYPYRDDIPNRHNASLVENVVQLWLLREAREIALCLPSKVATTLSEIKQGLNPKVIQRAQDCTVKLKRADPKNLRWIFSVDAGNGPKLVKLKVVRKGKAVYLSKLNVLFSCSCPAWRWLGPEYHAKGEDYLTGKPVGTASPPDIRDPYRINRVCKHVAAVIKHISDMKARIRK